ncbi:hypothetical protein F5887DRAFT_979609 [Amanita rubescens]|nr:hypothetical protein F5887DRAFT_979609 [Amanita rubescens]
MASNDDQPTPESFAHTIDLTTADSKITAVSVYTNRAEVTRCFRIHLGLAGQNQVKIRRLPNTLQDDSIRLEGRGPAMIHDVVVIPEPVPPKIETSPDLDVLVTRREHTTKELERCKTLRNAIGTYLATLHVKHVAVNQLDETVQGCDSAAGKLDDKAINLEKELKLIDEQIEEERQKDNAKQNDKLRFLRKVVSLSLFVQKECTVEVVLTYAVANASWSAQYDVRVDTLAKESPVTLIYKAAVTQNTAEDWEDVPLRLETATPTYQVGLPSLFPWTLSIYHPIPMPPQGAVRARTYRSQRRMERRSSASTIESVGHACYGANPLLDMLPSGATVTSKGNVSATFDVPGIITIPSDGAAHNVNIVKLNLEAIMSWVAVPKYDARTRLNAKIKNASEYTLLSGIGSIYVDGSFISKSNIPAVSPGESFDCALGLDPAIRIIYHPLSKKTAKSGFYTKTSVTSYTQRISVHNTKSITITDLLIMDQIPVSTDEKIVVKLFTPSLPTVQGNIGSTKGEKSANNAGTKVKVAQGVVAQWGDGTEDAATVEDGETAVGRDGKLSWVCDVSPQGKIGLALQWEVTAPAQAHVIGS